MVDQRLVIVTGASRGLGRAMADGFIQSGQTVAGCATSSESIAALKNDVPAPHRFDVVDVTDDHQVERWAKSIIEDLGPPDILINCAAVMNRNAPLWEVSRDEFSTIVDVNIKGVHNTIRHFVPTMVERGSGLVVNFSSYWGRSTSSQVAAYCATKWAIEGMSRGLADDLPSGMASVAFNPGIVHTEMLESCFAEAAKTYPSPQEWAAAAVPYLLGLGPQDNGRAVTVPGF